MKRTIWVVETKLLGVDGWDGGENHFFESKADAHRWLKNETAGVKARLWRFVRRGFDKMKSPKEFA